MKIRSIFVNIASLLIVPFIGCSKTNSKNSNEEYLKSLAGIIIECQAAKGRLPESIDEALQETHKMLKHRGDVNGYTIFYYRMDDSAFFIRSVGINQSDDKGMGDDVQVNLINGKYVSRDALIQYTKEKYPDEWGAHAIMLSN